MKAFASACIIVAFCVTTSLQSTPHTPCDKGSLPTDLRVDGCNTTPCKFYRGTDLTAQWDFVANDNTKSLRPVVKVKVLGIVTDYDYPEQDACKSLTNSKCPLGKGDKATYNLKMPILKSYPPVKLNIQFALVDEKDNVQVCFKLDGQVVDK